MPGISVHDLTELVFSALARNGFRAANARPIAEVVVAAESCGALSHGLFRLPGYISEVQSGWSDGNAAPRIVHETSSTLAVDGGNGYCQPAFALASQSLIAKARETGIGMLAIRNAHHLAALWPEAEHLARNGLVALVFRNGRSHVIPFGGSRKMLGTNPMAFACPWPGEGLFVFDQASTQRSRGDLTLSARGGEQVPPGMGVDRDGLETTDPAAILDGAMLPFGGYKGSLIAVMTEILAAAVAGGTLSLDDKSAGNPGAHTARAGQLVIAIDPGPISGGGFEAEISRFLDAAASSGMHMPGRRRQAALALSRRQGVQVDAAAIAELERLSALVPPPSRAGRNL